MPSCGVSPRCPSRLPTALVGGLLLLGLLVTATADMPVDPALASFAQGSHVAGVGLSSWQRPRTMRQQAMA